MNDYFKVYGNSIHDTGAALKKISGQKIYFGHQSVGYNMLSGLEQWEKETGVTIPTMETRDFSNTDGYSLVHFRVGQNKDPYSKIDDFVNLCQKIPKEESSMAFFKFCYVDFHHEADVNAIFENYKTRMMALRDSCRQCRIVLCTVPVTTLQSGPKALVKKILAKPLNNARENIRRNAFNEKIRAELAEEFPVFDLARVESTLPDGTDVSFTYEGINYPQLNNRYTVDGGHLNSYGARAVSFNLIAFLSEMVD